MILGRDLGVDADLGMGLEMGDFSMLFLFLTLMGKIDSSELEPSPRFWPPSHQVDCNACYDDKAKDPQQDCQSRSCD